MNNKDASEYQVEDFIMDESFVNYYFNRDEADRRHWESWLACYPSSAKMAREAGDLLGRLSLQLPAEEFNEEYNRIKQVLRTDSIPGRISHLGTPGRFLPDAALIKPTRRSRYLLLLPVIALIAFGIFYFYREPSGSEKDFVEKINNGIRPIILTLSDQTVVTLAPHSSLKYQKSFDETARKVYLQGEAEFNVTKDPKRPFCVYSGELVTSVLGTVFRIRQQQTDSVMLVELLTGRLKVETNETGQPGQTIFLAPSERVIYNRLDKKLTKQTWQEAATTPGKRGTLNFRKDDFESVARKIKTEFGLTVINLSEKKAWSFTGSFRDNTATEIVENICIVKQLAYEIKADTIFIK